MGEDRLVTPESVLLALIAVLLLAWVWLVYRLTNSRGTVSWELRTTEPESSRLRVERDEARREAEQFRDELRRADTLPPGE